MSRTTIPLVYPHEGDYDCTLHVRLSCVDEKARIYYTVDNGVTTTGSKEFIYENGVIPLKAVPGEEIIYTIRALAVSDGLEPSKVVEYRYRITSKPVGEYTVEVLRERTEKVCGVIRILDYDTDKMYLLVGSKSALLIDGGVESKGDLLSLCEDLVGTEIPIAMFIGHAHLDHYGQAGNFIEAGKTVYMSHKDFGCIAKLHMPSPVDDVKSFADVQDGDIYDLGNCTLRAYCVPGHTPASMVLIDECTGDVYSSDAFGSARRHVPDSLFMQLGDEECALDAYLAAVESFVARTSGKLGTMFTGHSDEPIPANEYLALLIDTLKDAIDKGDDALIPSVRSQEESVGSGCIAALGNYRMDPIWTMINVMYIYAADARKNPPVFAKGFNPAGGL